jgi:hypothetical protein
MTNFKKQMIELGLIDQTTKRQRKSGTEIYFDPSVNERYGTYESGYVRRLVTYKVWHTRDNVFATRMYPLNPRTNPDRWGMLTYELIETAEARQELLIKRVKARRLKLNVK